MVALRVASLPDYFREKSVDEYTNIFVFNQITISDNIYFDLSKRRIVSNLSNPFRYGAICDTRLLTLKARFELPRFFLKLARIGCPVSFGSCYSRVHVS